ncbi:MAG TPA: ferrochelatase [Rhabdochlamydiaceae bacterium]|jgi:ferrochelatase
MQSAPAYLIVNFGGPRDLGEVEEFLVCLFRDREVLRTPLPAWVHNILFTHLAKKRAKSVVRDYAKIGGGSPIYQDTEEIAQKASRLLGSPVLTFHRYLPKTHAAFAESMHRLDPAICLRVFPLFAQFSYATTGSIATWFSRHLRKKLTDRMQWIPSYFSHPAYIRAFENRIRAFLDEHGVREEKTVLLFSAHGLPLKFIQTGDVYETQCRSSFNCLAAHFPLAKSLLCYQSQLGKKEWIRPYTSDMCGSVKEWGTGYETIVIVPLSFTSDHIETLFEVEEQYMPPIAKRGFHVLRCPALNQAQEWIEAIVQIMRAEKTVPMRSLIREKWFSARKRR